MPNESAPATAQAEVARDGQQRLSKGAVRTSTPPLLLRRLSKLPDMAACRRGDSVLSERSWRHSSDAVPSPSDRYVW